MNYELVVAAAQMESVPGATASNVDKHLSMLTAAAAANVQLLVFPELSLVGHGAGRETLRLAMPANDPVLLKRTWEDLKAVMVGEGALDPLVREMIYIAVSSANGCQYCVHSHTAAARAKGMTDAQYGELLAVIGLAGKTNHLVTAMQIPADPEFQVGR